MRSTRSGSDQHLRAGEFQSPDPNFEYITDRLARLNLGQFPLARAPRTDILDRAVAMQALHGRTNLFANRGAQNRVAGIEALGGDHPARNLIGAQRLARCGSQHAKAEPREFIAGEIPVAAICALRPNRLRVEIRRENAQRAVYVRQVRAVLVKLAL